MSIISNLVRKSLKKDKLKILTFFYDGKFDLELLETGHDFYGYLEHSSYQWPGFKSAMYPNLHILQNPGDINSLDFDLILFNNRFVNAQFFGMCRQLHLPALIIDHDSNVQNAFIREKNKQFTAFPHISTNSYLQQQYESEEVIYYGIEKKSWEHEKDIEILCTVSHQHDVNIVHEIKRNFPQAVFIGQHQNVPYAGLVDTYEDYKRLFRRSKLFVNLSPQLNLNYDILLALNDQVPIISHHLPIYNGLLENNVNYIRVSSPEEIIMKIKQLSFDKSLYNKISNHSTNLDNFNKQAFVDGWDKVLRKHASRVYIE